jgi:hypothetical protein
MVFEYLERTFLQSCLLKDNSAILNMLQKEKIRVYYNGEELKDPSQKPIKSVFNFEFNKPFQLKKDSKFLQQPGV